MLNCTNHDMVGHIGSFGSYHNVSVEYCTITINGENVSLVRFTANPIHYQITPLFKIAKVLLVRFNIACPAPDNSNIFKIHSSAIVNFQKHGYFYLQSQ